LGSDSTTPALTAVLLLGGALTVACASGRAQQGEAEPARQSLVLVSMDTCRYDHLGLAGYPHPTTPNLDRLAARGTSFSQHYVQSNETLYSHAAVFTGRYPGELASLTDDFHLPAELTTLTDVLSLYGYRTAAFTGGAHMKGRLGFADGFELYLDDLDFASFFHSEQAAEVWLDGLGPEEPFFLFVHGYDCHSPYRTPLFVENIFDPDYQGVANEIAGGVLGIESVWRGRYFPLVERSYAYNDEGRRYLDDDFFMGALPRAAAEGSPSVELSQADLDHLVAHYDAGLRYGDFWLGMLLARLEDLGVLDHTVVAVFSDHGEGLTDHDHFHHRPSLDQTILHAPLVIRDPSLPTSHGRRVDELVRAIDITPTLLEAVGVPPVQGVPGRSLRSMFTDDAALPVAPAFAESRTQIAVRVPGELLVVDKTALDPRREGPGGEGFHYHGFEGELPAGQPPVGADALGLRLMAWYEGITPSSQGDFEMDEELRKALEERGYW
jgi:arylsulfatase A-like enzyme